MFNFKGQGKGLAIAAMLFGIERNGAGSRRRPTALLQASATPRVRRSAGGGGGRILRATMLPNARAGPTQPRDIVMSQTAWRDLVKVNRWVNETIKPLTDMEHWGVIEKWSLPTRRLRRL